MGLFQSKKSYQVEKEEKKKGVVERKPSSKKPDVKPNILQMTEEARQSILEADKRSSARSLNDTERVQNEIATNNAENIKSVQSAEDVQIRNTETEIKGAESISKPENDDVTNIKAVQNIVEEKELINTENKQGETETKNVDDFKKPEVNLMRTTIVEMKEAENNENINTSNKEDVIKNDVPSNKEDQSTKEAVSRQTNDQPADLIQTRAEQSVQEKPEDSPQDKPAVDTKIVNQFEETPAVKEAEKLVANDNEKETKTTEVCKLEEREENIVKEVEPEKIVEEKPVPKESEEIVTESEAKQNENIQDSNEAIKVKNEIKDNETSVERIAVIDVHSPIEPTENIKIETYSTERKIETKKLEINNEETVHNKTNVKQIIETPDLNKIEVYSSEETQTQEIKLHENKTENEESSKDNIEFDVEVYKYKEDNQERIVEIEETSFNVTSMKIEDTRANTENHDVKAKSLKQSEKETTNIASTNNDNNNLEESVTIIETTTSEKESKQLSPNHVEIQTKTSEEKTGPFLRVHEIEEEVKILKEQVILFSGTTKDKDYLTLKEMLVRCMINLDDVAVANNDELRNERRKVIKFAQDSLDTLQRNAVQADESSEDESDTETN